MLISLREIGIAPQSKSCTVVITGRVTNVQKCHVGGISLIKLTIQTEKQHDFIVSFVPNSEKPPRFIKNAHLRVIAGLFDGQLLARHIRTNTFEAYAKYYVPSISFWKSSTAQATTGVNNAY